jgi:AAA+ ATPase superfamily predicted ATPase
MGMFIGRDKEIGTLKRHYASGDFEFITIYGRRRVGKTTLIMEFCKGKKTILFPALETNAKNNLAALSSAIFSCMDPEMKTCPSFDGFQQAFNYIAERTMNERIIFVIDEFPYLAESDLSISSVLQNTIDHKFKKTKLMLILCGSSMSFMEKQVLNYKSPLYGRRTAQIKLLPFSYFDAAQWFPSYPPEQQALAFAVLGGIPMYLEKFSAKKNVYQNILNSVMRTDAVLFEEPSNLLKQELREPQTYNAIITAIADGKTKLSEIASAVGLETGSLTKYIDNLISLGIVKKEKPLLSNSGKKTIYLIADHFFRFWYKFVPRNMAAILSDNIAKIFDTAIKAHLSEYMGLAFEEICKEFLFTRAQNLPFVISQIGQWWGGNPATKKEAQIDIVALSPDKTELITGSCKYRNEKTALGVLTELKEYTAALGGKYKKTYYYIFSKAAFSSALIDAAKSDTSIRLISLDEMYAEEDA